MGNPKRKSRKTTREIPFTLIDPVSALQSLLEKLDNKGVIVGGLAASLLGRPRLTVDLDAVVLASVDDLPNLIEAVKNEGIAPRIPDPEVFAHKNWVLLLRHEISGINIDISLGILPFEEEMVERGLVVKIGEFHLRLPTPEDLIIMKAITHRSRI